MKTFFLFCVLAVLAVGTLFSRETVRQWRYDLGYGEED